MTEPQDVSQAQEVIRSLTARVTALEQQVARHEAALAKTEELATWFKGRRQALDRWAEIDERSKNP